MDDVLSFVLDGLEDYLELERELGVRSVEVDRSLLATPPSSVVAVAPRVAPVVPTAKRDVSTPQSLTPSTPQPLNPSTPQRLTPVAFIHDRPLSPKAVAMMAKTIVALGYADDATPVVVTRPIPKARRYVFLGHRALQTYLPGLRVEENARFRTPKGVEALLVKSPEEIVRFATETPAVHQAKTAMWHALKAFAMNMPQLLLLLFAPVVAWADAGGYTNHAGNVVAGFPVSLTAREVVLAIPPAKEGETYPLSIFPEPEQRRIAADFGAPRVPPAVRRTVDGAKKAMARSRKRAEKGLCTKEESEAFCAKSEAALRSYLDRQVQSGAITFAERHALWPQ